MERGGILCRRDDRIQSCADNMFLLLVPGVKHDGDGGIRGIVGFELRHQFIELGMHGMFSLLKADGLIGGIVDWISGGMRLMLHLTI